MRDCNANLLFSRTQTLANVKIERGICQGDSLSQLFFVLTMIQSRDVVQKTKLGYDLGNRIGN